MRLKRLHLMMLAAVSLGCTAGPGGAGPEGPNELPGGLRIRSAGPITLGSIVVAAEFAEPFDTLVLLARRGGSGDMAPGRPVEGVVSQVASAHSVRHGPAWQVDAWTRLTDPQLRLAIASAGGLMLVGTDPGEAERLSRWLEGIGVAVERRFDAQSAVLARLPDDMATLSRVRRYEEVEYVEAVLPGDVDRAGFPRRFDFAGLVPPPVSGWGRGRVVMSYMNPSRTLRTATVRVR